MAKALKIFSSENIKYIILIAIYIYKIKIDILII